MQLFEIIRSIIFIILLLFFSIFFIIKKEKNSMLSRIIIILMILRLLYSIIRFWFNLPPDMPDNNFFEDELNIFVNTHMSLESINSRFDVRNYIILQGVIRYFFGNTWMVTVCVNSILGTIAIYISGNIAYQISGIRAKQITILLLSFEPTILLYTNTHLREAIVLVTLTLAFLQLIKYIKYKKSKDIILFLLISIVSGLFRSVNLFMLIIVGSLSVFLVNNKIKFNFKKVITIILIFLFFILILEILNNVLNFSIDIKYINENLNRDLLGGGTMPYLIGERYESWIHLVISIPKRMIYFLLHPFPWKIGNIRHIIPFISSMYNLIFIIIGILIYKIRRNKMFNKNLIIKTVILLVVGLIVYSVAKSESASRHRLQFIWLIPVIVSTMLVNYNESLIDIKRKDKWKE